MARRELTCESFLIYPDGRTVPVQALSDGERELWRENMRRRLSRELSGYYTQHPAEYEALCRELDEREGRTA